MAIDLLAGGNRAAFSRSLGLSPWAMKGWLCNGERPTLPQLLSVCQGLGIMPGQLFLSDPNDLIPSLRDKIHPVPSRLHERADRPLLCVREQRRLRADLVAIIENHDDDRSLKDVARDMGLTRSCLKYWFPDESRAIMARYAEIRNQRAIRYAMSQQDEVAWVVRQFYLRGEYPSKRKVNRELSRRKMALAQPHLLEAYRSTMDRI
jgi:AraC-like DNA-binding protein